VTCTFRDNPVSHPIRREVLSADVLFAYALDAVTVKTKLFARAIGVLLKIVGRQELASLTDAARGQFVDVVPSEIHGTRPLAQHLGVLVLDSDFERFG